MAEPSAQPKPDSGNGFPEGFQLFMLEGMEGLNTKAQRPAIEDQQWSWSENYIPIGAANARALYGTDEPIFTGATIVNHAYYNIGAVAFGIVFKLDGSAVQFRLSDGALTTVGPPGTFYAAGNIETPTIVQWADKGILIVSVFAADAYWAWDLTAGGTLYSPGDASPDWLNGGTPTTMPTGIAGTAIEIFLNRVWIVNATTRLTSVASNGADFSTGNGGVSAPNTDSSLRVRYTGIKAANGYLYYFGDSECAYVTNVQTSTTPTTTYQYTVIDPQIGTPWRDTVIPFGRSILFANSNGVYALYGSSANKISDMLDGIWNDTVADFTTVVPTAGVATMFGIKVFCIAFRTTDPTTNTKRTIMACFDGKKWFPASQVPAPTLLAPQETNSELVTYGSDGTTIFKLFDSPDPTLSKVMVSKLWGGQFGFIMYKMALRFYTEVQPINNTSLNLDVTLDTDSGSSAGTVSFAQDITFVNDLAGVLQFQNNSFQDLFFQSGATISRNNIDGQGLLLGFTLTSTSPDYVIERIAIGYKNETALY